MDTRKRGWAVRGMVGVLATAIGLIPAAPSAAAPPIPPRLAAGGLQGCLLNGGAAYCWGDNGNGAVGDGTTVDRSSPVAVDTGGALAGVTLTQISVGTAHTCALSMTGTAYCWGLNDNGQVGDTTTVDRSSPVAVDTGGVLAGVTLIQIEVGDHFSCAISAGGAVYCWGDNFAGQLGDGTNNSQLSPVATDLSAVTGAGVRLSRIAAGGHHTCALSTVGTAYCWGDNSFGQLGDGSLGNQLTPVAVDTGGVLAGITLTRLDSGGLHTCALSAAGAAYCWGANLHGGLGDGTSSDQISPVAVDTGGALLGVTLTQVDTGGEHTCALSAAGAAYCWGANFSGGLGDGTGLDQSSPVAVDTRGVLDGVMLSQLSAGGDHSCAVSAAGVSYCWGANSDGQVGDGTTTDRLSPVRVNGIVPDEPTGATATATAGDRSIAVSWMAPGRIGTGSLTGYTATASPGGATCTTTTTPLRCVITGLTPGVPYTMTVVAHSSAGDSGPSAASNAVTLPIPPVLPGPPTGVIAVAGDASIIVSWTAPADSGTGTVTGYTAMASPGGANCTATTQTQCTITGLTNGTAYTVAVVTHTGAGDSIPGSAPGSVTPFALPGPPAGVTVTAGDASIMVSWTAPANSAIVTGYTATASPGGASCTTTTQTQCTITGLVNGTAYTVTVVAHSSAGDSDPGSAPTAVSPAAAQPALTVTGQSLTRVILLGLGLLAAGIAAVAAGRWPRLAEACRWAGRRPRPIAWRA